MEPGKTSFFQALGVPTKIARGTIEITTDLKLVEAKAKVGPSEATLLNMLNISPFTYGLGVEQVYDQGQVFPPEILDIGDEQLLKALSSAITTVATISLAINFPTLPSVMHSVVNSYKKVLAVAVETDFSWPEIEQLKDRIANPDAYAAAAPAAAAGGASADAPAEEAKKDESEEEEDDEGFGGLLYVYISPNSDFPLLGTKTLTSTPQRLNRITNFPKNFKMGVGQTFDFFQLCFPPRLQASCNYGSYIDSLFLPNMIKSKKRERDPCFVYSIRISSSPPPCNPLPPFTWLLDQKRRMKSESYAKG